MKFEIKFKRTVEEYYTCVVEADSKTQALEMFDKEPFNCDEISDKPYDVAGLSIDVARLSIDVVRIKKLKEE
jgi:hypothetical protein